MRSDVINGLLCFAHSHKIDYIMSTTLPIDMPSFVLFGDKSKEIIVNLNYDDDDKKIPFVIAHEVAHAMLCTKEDTELYSKTLLHDKYEYKANCIAVRLLLPYYLDGLDEIEQVNVNDFMEMFELTDDMYDACVKIMKKCIAA